MMSVELPVIDPKLVLGTIHPSTGEITVSDKPIAFNCSLSTDCCGNKNFQVPINDMDIERIELLRGPQATYFGRGAMGGGVSVTTKKPDNDLYGSVMFDYGRYDTMDIEGVFNIPVAEDVLAIRGNVKYNESDGHIENVNARGGGNEFEYKYARLAMR